MMRTLPFLVLGCLLIYPGCKSASAELADRSVALLEGGLVVLEIHQQTPDRAPSAFQVYLERNQGEIQALKRLSNELGVQQSKEQAAAVKRRFLERIKGLMPRLRAMAALYGSEHEVMTALEQLQPRVTR